MRQTPPPNRKGVYEIPKPWAVKFPELVKPLCSRKSSVHGWYSCGNCMTARAVAFGTKYSKRMPDGATQPYSTEEALTILLDKCRMSRERSKEKRTVVNEIRREGARIIKPGANVFVQLKRKKGTRKDTGYVVECYENNTAKIHISSLGKAIIVPVDDFVTGRKGTTNK